MCCNQDMSMVYARCAAHSPMPSKCAGRREQRLTLPAVERPKAAPEVDPASEVLECCVGITGDEPALNLFL